jgi:3-phenylpropionate/trans-cinnamate dioxygenase ferredoxin subunit
MSWHVVSELDHLELNTPLQIDLDGDQVLVVRTANGVFAVSDVCSHAEVSLSEGTVTDQTIECWLHGAKFDLDSGEAVCLPATRPIETYAVRIVEDSVHPVVEISVKNQEQE